MFEEAVAQDVNTPRLANEGGHERKAQPTTHTHRHTHTDMAGMQQLSQVWAAP